MRLMVISSTLITLALVFYSLGVWAEKLGRYLKQWHVYAFWTGFLFDCSGTFTMHLMAKHAFSLHNLHTLTGQIALWLMFAHAVWATWVAWKGSESLRIRFNRYSIVVWVIWLIPFFGGMAMAMTRR